VKNRCDIFKKMILNEEFVEAHEVLEDPWKRYKKTDPVVSNILKGFINGATALALYKRGNLKGYEKVWKTFLKYEVLIEKNSENFELFEEIRSLLHSQKNKIASL